MESLDIKKQRMEKFLKKKQGTDNIRNWNENVNEPVNTTIQDKPIIQNQDQRGTKDFRKIYKTSLVLENKLKIASLLKFIVLLICVLLVIYKVDSLMIMSIFLILEPSYIFYYYTIRKQINNTISVKKEDKGEISYVDLFYKAIDYYKIIVSNIYHIKIVSNTKYHDRLYFHMCILFISVIV